MPTALAEIISSLKLARKLLADAADLPLSDTLKILREIDRNVHDALKEAEDASAEPQQIWLVEPIDGSGLVFAFSGEAEAGAWAKTVTASCVISTRVLNHPELVEAVTQ